MWYIILAVVVLSTGAGLAYLGTRLSALGFIGKLSGGNQMYARFWGFVLTFFVFTLLSLWLNLMNAVICLLHFVVIWLFCNALSAVFRRLFKSSGKSRWTAPLK